MGSVSDNPSLFKKQLHLDIGSNRDHHIMRIASSIDSELTNNEQFYSMHKLNLNHFLLW